MGWHGLEWALTIANAAGINGLTYLPNHAYILFNVGLKLRRMLRMFGHVESMDERNMIKDIYEAYLIGNAVTGRPRRICNNVSVPGE
jgi:hypothetical protein